MQSHEITLNQNESEVLGRFLLSSGSQNANLIFENKHEIFGPLDRRTAVRAIQRLEKNCALKLNDVVTVGKVKRYWYEITPVGFCMFCKYYYFNNSKYVFKPTSFFKFVPHTARIWNKISNIKSDLDSENSFSQAFNSLRFRTVVSPLTHRGISIEKSFHNFTVGNTTSVTNLFFYSPLLDSKEKFYASLNDVTDFVQYYFAYYYYDQITTHKNQLELYNAMIKKDKDYGKSTKDYPKLLNSYIENFSRFIRIIESDKEYFKFLKKSTENFKKNANAVFEVMEIK